ncbi:sigma-70 family RNA polymerase sigma factor [Marmoricola sp. URHB0036]|uniref:sigma-70 family RNA polymerase sigma factor n=1 Tax=Marmoricola sp. URHB0036 TaxID=1298863 RepID=UPI000423ED20
MGVMESADASADPGEDPDITALIPVVRRVIRARVSDPSAAEDLVQETLVRVLGAAHRIEPGTLEPYAIVTARNVVASMWKERDRHRRNQHRVLDLSPVEAPDDELLRQEDEKAITTALERLSERERQTLLAHEVSGLDTRVLGDDLGLTAGAVAAQLNRTRARLRVEYLLALHDISAPTPQCRPVLLALSSGERRRQREVHAARHLLECDVCADLSLPLMSRGQQSDTEVRVPIHDAPDVVLARKQARELASRLGFSGTDQTILATAVSEIARNIVRFAGKGVVLIEMLDDPRPGLRVTASDTGPGITDVDRALRDGYSTYNGLGMGLPGARRLMDEFTLVSELGRGTTVTMTKWRQEGTPHE